MTIIYAAQNSDGAWTGAQYGVTSAAIRTHHHQYGETLHAVAALHNAGSDFAPHWEAMPADPAELRAAMAVSRYQARAALRGAGHLDQVDAMIAASADVMMIDAWSSAVEIRRVSPMIMQMAAALGLTDEQVDDLFRAAAIIEA